MSVALSVFTIWTFACSRSGSDGNSNATAANQNVLASNTNSVKDNTEELGNIIRLPETPEEAVWREDETADPKGKKLVAVLKYSPETAAKVVAAAEKIKLAEPVEISSESWFPDELTAQSQLSGNESIKGTAYSANDFYNSVYTNGRLSRVNDTTYFVLELTTY